MQPESVRVVAPIRGVKLVFGSVFGATHLDVSAQAQASLKLDSISDCALCVVGLGPHDLQNGDATISGGSVSINGDVSLKSQGELTAAGEPNEDGTQRGDDQRLRHGDRDAFTRRLCSTRSRSTTRWRRSRCPATWRTSPRRATPTRAGTGAGHGPGVYGDFGSSSTARSSLASTSSPATGRSLDRQPDGTGVTLYFTCGTQASPRACNAPGEEGGALLAHGNGNINLTAPTSGAYAGWPSPTTG